MTDLNLNGITDLPAGKLANIVTYLEMREPPVRAKSNSSVGLSVRKIDHATAVWYRDLFYRIGKDWLWFSRLQLGDGALAAVIEDPQVDIYALQSNGEDIGMLELDRRIPPDIELAYFGLLPDAVGKGAGTFLMDEAIRLAFEHQPRRFWVHTCTLDHPRAVQFYMKSGFKPYKRAIEVVDDPRLRNVLPSDAAAHVPII